MHSFGDELVSIQWICELDRLGELSVPLPTVCDISSEPFFFSLSGRRAASLFRWLIVDMIIITVATLIGVWDYTDINYHQ